MRIKETSKNQTQIAKIDIKELENFKKELLNLGFKKRTLHLINANKTTNCSVFLQKSRNFIVVER